MVKTKRIEKIVLQNFRGATGSAITESWRLIELYNAARLASDSHGQASECLQRASERAASIRESAQEVKESKANMKLIRLLQEARDYLAAKAGDDSCPVCLQ